MLYSVFSGVENPIRTIKVENHSLCFGLFCKTALETPGYWLGICRPNTHRTKNSVGNLTLILTSTKFTRQTMPDCRYEMKQGTEHQPFEDEQGLLVAYVMLH